jgi:hypothetical protein
MLRFVARFGLVRLIGRRAIPALIVWDLAGVANRTRQIALVDRTLRRGASAARRGIGSAVSRRRRRTSEEGSPPASSDPSDA